MIEDGLKDAHAQAIETILVTECTGGDIESGAYRLHSTELDVQAYQLRDSLEQGSSQQFQGLEDLADGDGPSSLRILQLPNQELDGLWES